MSKVTWSRREFLRSTGRGLVFCGTAGALSSALTACEVHTEVPRISGALRRFVTPTDGPLADDFYIRFGNPGTSVANHPRLRGEDWSLAITGAVESPLTIGFDDVLSAGESVGLVFLKTMRCVFDAPFDPLISNGYWRGVPLSHFIEQAGPLPGASRLLMTAEDGFTNNLRLPRIVDNRADGVDADVPLIPVVLAYELNGEPIPTIHGGPVRIVVAEKFGYKNMKWPREIEVTESDELFGYYETDLLEGTSAADLGNIALTSFTSGPVEGEAVTGPTVDLFGVAMNGPGAVDRVEVAIDGGSFEPVELIAMDDILTDPVLFFGEDNSARRRELETLRGQLVQSNDSRFEAPFPYVWVLWQLTVELSRGDHVVQVRAFGTDGSEQLETDRDPDDGDSQIRDVLFTVI